MSEQPPPYFPPAPGGPSAPHWPPAFTAQPAAFPGSPYQTFPQTSPGDHSYYQGPMGHPGPYPSQHGYPGYPAGSHGTPHSWEGSRLYGEPPKNTLYMVEQNHGEGGGGGGAEKSCLAACSAALCCCCLWDMLTSNLG